MIRPLNVQDGQVFIIRYTKQKFSSESDAKDYLEILDRGFNPVNKNVVKNMKDAENAFKVKFEKVFGTGYMES